MSQPTDPPPVSTSLIITRDADDELRIVARNGDPVDWRRLSNAYRGRQLHSIRVRAIAGLSGDAHDTSVVPVDAARGRGTSAVMVSVDEGVTPQSRSIGTWAWESLNPEAPPVLHLSPPALDLLGTPLEQRDRSVYGPADFCSRLPRLADALSEMHFVYEAPLGSSRVRSMPIEHPDGATYTLWCSEVVVGGEARTIRGCCWLAGDDGAPSRMHDLSDARLSTLLARTSKQMMLVGDVRFPHVPYILKWLTPYPATVGHGVSTGQTLGVHPEDLGYFVESIIAFVQSGGAPELSSVHDVRVRRAGGGWLHASGTAYLVDQRLPTIAVLVLSSLE